MLHAAKFVELALAVLVRINLELIFQTSHSEALDHQTLYKWCSDQNKARWLRFCNQSNLLKHSHGHCSKPNYLNQCFHLGKKFANHTSVLFVSDTWTIGHGSKPNYLNQYYCVTEKCPNHTSVHIWYHIRSPPMHNDCSDSKPCRNVKNFESAIAFLPKERNK